MLLSEPELMWGADDFRQVDRSVVDPIMAWAAMQDGLRGEASAKLLTDSATRVVQAGPLTLKTLRLGSPSDTATR